jgi:hypothetical protein
MTDTEERRPDRRRRCAREGCGRPVKNTRPHCSLICSVFSDEIDRAQRLCQALGGDTEHWSAITSLGDALSDLFESDRRIFLAARAVGITPAAWEQIKRGADQSGHRGPA